MYAVINKYGHIISFENKDFGDPRFSYIEISSEAAVGLRAQRKAGKIPMYVEGEFICKDPRRSKTWDDIRKEREPKLEEADAMIFKLTDEEILRDVDNTNAKILWASYREGLRDITESSEDPDNVSWPSKPE